MIREKRKALISFLENKAHLLFCRGVFLLCAEITGKTISLGNVQKTKRFKLKINQRCIVKQLSGEWVTGCRGGKKNPSCHRNFCCCFCINRSRGTRTRSWRCDESNIWSRQTTKGRKNHTSYCIISSAPNVMQGFDCAHQHYGTSCRSPRVRNTSVRTDGNPAGCCAN